MATHTLKIDIDDQAKTDLSEYAMAQNMTLTGYVTHLVLAAANRRHADPQADDAVAT